MTSRATTMVGAAHQQIVSKVVKSSASCLIAQDVSHWIFFFFNSSFVMPDIILVRKVKGVGGGVTKESSSCPDDEDVRHCPKAKSSASLELRIGELEEKGTKQKEELGSLYKCTNMR